MNTILKYIQFSIDKLGLSNQAELSTYIIKYSIHQ